jgi:hypothetical protein
LTEQLCAETAEHDRLKRAVAEVEWMIKPRERELASDRAVRLRLAALKLDAPLSTVVGLLGAALAQLAAIETALADSKQSKGSNDE